MTAAESIRAMEIEMTDEVATETPVSEIALFKSGGEAKAEAPKGEVAATPAARERDESGKFKGKPEEVADTTKVEKVETKGETEVKTDAKTTEKTPVSALITMRQRLQAAENRVRELEAGQTKAETPDIFTDPEKAVKALVDQQVAPIKTKFFKRSIEDAGKAHADFDDAAENFAKLIESSPALLAEMQAAEDPGEYIYQIGSNTPEFRQARESKYRDEVSAKDTEIAALKAQVAALEGAQKVRESVPESLNRQPSGAVPERDSDKTDVSQIVRFKSG